MGVYKLPFPEGKSYRVSQGNNEMTSHHGKARFAFDFAMPEGDLIVAARAGTVARVQESYSACGGEELANKTNFVLIEHYDDNSSDLYLHICQNSAGEFGIVPGATVQQGQTLARAGKVGWTWCGAHLHFQRQERGVSWWQQSLPVAFAEVAGGIPTTGQWVTSQNAKPAEGGEPVAPVTLQDALRQATFDEVGVPYHPTENFYQYALTHRLGAALSGHFRLTVEGTAYDCQIYAVDTLCAPIAFPEGYIDWARTAQMSALLIANPEDALGLALLRATFRAANHTFHPEWATHQFYLAQLSRRPLGAPLGPVQVLEVCGGRYDVEVFSLDTLYTLEPNWQDIRRLSDLLAQLQHKAAAAPGNP